MRIRQTETWLWAMLLAITGCATLKKPTAWQPVVANFSLSGEQSSPATIWGRVQPQYQESRQYSDGTKKIIIDSAYFQNETEAIASFLSLREKQAPNFNFSTEKIRWGFISRRLTTAGFWHNKSAWLLTASEKLSREEWSQFLTAFTASFEKGNSRPAMFALFLREETDLQQVIFDEEGYFSAPWKSDHGKTGSFGFRTFPDNLRALNHLNTLTTGENHSWEQRQVNRHTLQLVVAPETIYFQHENHVLLLKLKQANEAELLAEWIKIVRQLGY